MAAAQILCTKCGTASAEPRLECAKCGGRNARVCGACGMQNSVAKNFCDKCGRSISELGPIAPPPKTLLPGQPAAEIPATAIKRLPPAAPPPGPIPSGPAPAPGPKPPSPPAPFPVAGRPLPPPGGPTKEEFADLWTAAPPGPAFEAEAAAPARGRWRAALNVLAGLAGVAAAAYGVWFWRESRRPEVLVPKLAAQYLESLRRRDYAAAYALFSERARKSCALDEFAASRDTTTWTWSSLRIEHQEPGAVLLAYDLKVAGAPPRVDHVLFTLEKDGWTRPYNWTLMREVEAAFDKGDADRGLILAQAAAEINPRDPMAWGYLCEAAYYRKSAADTELRCLKTLELARTYPSSLTLKSLYHLHAILADTYNHALNRPDKALDQFGEMLSFPEISPADQCQILLARSESYERLSRPGEALADLERGAQLCDSPQDQAYIQKMRESLRAPTP